MSAQLGLARDALGKEKEANEQRTKDLEVAKSKIDRDMKVVLKEKEEAAVQLVALREALSKAKEEHKQSVKSLEADRVKAEEDLRVAQGDVGSCLVERAKETKVAAEERAKAADLCQEETRRVVEQQEKEAAQRLEEILQEKNTIAKELEAAKGKLISCKTAAEQLPP